MQNLFKWNLMLVTPIIVLKLMIANGVIFDNEDFPKDIDKI